MAQDLAPIFGNGSDGEVTLSGTDAPIDSSCSGSSGALSLSATNASFAAGQKILIHQSRGTGAGQWEVNEILSYVAGTITLKNPLAFTYTDSGASQAQVLVLKQYSKVTISATLTVKAWDGNIGGIVAFLCNGAVNISGTLAANGASGAATTGTGDATSGGGFRGGIGGVGDGFTGWQGEGTSAASSNPTDGSANGNGGGGGNAPIGGNKGGGGGGANGAVGTANNAAGSGTGGQGGAVAGNAALTTMVFGGGGGGAASSNGGTGPVSSGSSGGGIVMIFAKTITITGTINANGGNINEQADTQRTGGGGGGGSILLKGQTITVGTNLVTATTEAGAGGLGQGGAGRIALHGCSISGTTNPAATSSVGNAWCASEVGGMI